MANLTRPDEALALRTTLLCGLVVVLEGYDLSTLGFVVPQLADAWQKPPVAFTTALTASNLGSLSHATRPVSRSVVGFRCASRWYPMSVHRAGRALSSS
jgi:hypothetical protein